MDKHNNPESKAHDLKETKHSLEHIKISIKDGMCRLTDFLEAEGLQGLSTGFLNLDKATDGLKKGELILISGRPAMGKSALASNIATNIAIGEGVPVAIFCPEMDKSSCALRMLFSHAEVDLIKFRAEECDENDFLRINNSIKILNDALIYLNSWVWIDVDEIRSCCLRLKEQIGDLGLIVIDYFDLLKPPAGVEDTETEEILLERLKSLARELKIPVIAIYMLGRIVEERKDHRPRFSDILGPWMENYVDVIVFIYRPEYYDPEDPEKKGKAELIIPYNKHGCTGVVPLKFKKQYIRFEHVDECGEEPY